MKTRTAPLSLLFISYLIFFTMAVPTGILNVAWTNMQTTYSVGLESLGVLLLAGTCGSLIGTFFSGRLIGRFGIGTFLSTGSVIAAFGLLGYSLAPTWIALLLVGFTTALGISVFNAGLNTFVSANYTTGQLNWLHAAYALGVTTGPTLTTLLVQRFSQSWHLCYLIVFVVMLVIVLLLLITRPRWILPNEVKPGAPAERVNFWESLLLPEVLIGMALFFVFNGVISGTGQLSNTLLTSRGVPNAGYWISFYWGFFFLGRLIMGFVAYRVANTTLIRACIIGVAIGAALLWQSASDSLNLIGLALIGLSSAPMFPTLIAETRQRVEPRHSANAIGFQIAASGLGTSLIPGAMAWLAAHTVVGVIGALPLIGVLMVLALHEVAVRRREHLPTTVGI